MPIVSGNHPNTSPLANRPRAQDDDVGGRLAIERYSRAARSGRQRDHRSCLSLTIPGYNSFISMLPIGNSRWLPKVAQESNITVAPFTRSNICASLFSSLLTRELLAGLLNYPPHAFDLIVRRLMPLAVAVV
jgi:hypothetical protein